MNINKLIERLQKSQSEHEKSRIRHIQEKLDGIIFELELIEKSQKLREQQV